MTTSRLSAGASGDAFKEWKGNFYPEKIKPEEMLGYYAERLPAVEINNTFRRMPRTAVLETWAGSTSESFRFANYSDDDLRRWARRLEGTSWRQIHVYFMHEPTAPAYARALMGFAALSA